jgi:hypothetical protein
MRKFLLVVAAVAATGLVVAAAAGAATDRDVNPVFVSGNPDCKDLAGVTSAIQAKFDAPTNGATDGRVHLLLLTTGVSWYVLNNEDVDAVIVKGGSGANVYRYPGPGPGSAAGDFSDGGLTTPLNKGGKPAALGYVTVCYTP